MEKKNKNEEIQSRRDFFKKAVKGVLPILGAIILTNVPAIARTSETQTGCGGLCQSTCTQTCASNCRGGCKGRCDGGCKNGCYGSCYRSCAGGCKNSSRSY